MLKLKLQMIICPQTLQNSHYSVEQQLVEEAFSVGSENNFADQSIKGIKLRY